MVDVYCSECDCLIVGKGKTLFSGFVEFTCPECEAKVLAPMPTRIRIAYALFSAFGLFAVVKKMLQGELPPPGTLLLALFLVLLVHDWRLRQQALP